MTLIEVLDDDEMPATDLVVSMKDMIVKPVNPALEKEYNFTVKATISGGDYTITTKKKLRVLGEGTLEEI